jgi:NADP-dependent 3-hydroxy acid dehydrogenase YdfG
MAENGFFVYAGARKQRDLEELNKIENMQSVRLDVTVQSEIDAAMEFVASEGRGLYALVNNAGVLVTGPSSEVSVDKVKWIFDVNVFGVYRVTQAFVPLII